MELAEAFNVLLLKPGDTVAVPTFLAWQAVELMGELQQVSFFISNRAAGLVFAPLVAHAARRAA